MFLEICKIHMKTPVLEPLFLKRDSSTGVFLWVLRISKNAFVYIIPADGCFIRVHDIIILYSCSTYYSCKKYNQPLIRKKWNKYFKLRN